jgi:hypothetical protein
MPDSSLLVCLYEFLTTPKSAMQYAINAFRINRRQKVVYVLIVNSHDHAKIPHPTVRNLVKVREEESTKLTNRL